MAYSSIVKPSVHFNTKLYTGNATNAHAITGVGFQPDWTWIKDRGDTSYHILTDAVRGATKTINSNTNSAQVTNTEHLQSFNSDGFTLGISNAVNQNGVSNASWNWKANGAGSSNTDGSINTTYTSVNTTAGFSISSYTGTGSNATVGHGLGSIPKMIIVKNLSSAYEWGVYHKSLGATKNIYLDSTGGAGNATFWNNTEPTSSVFNVGTTAYTNGSGSTYIAYCFAEKTGYSKFGSYTGNGNADGPFIYTGFKPAFVLQKRSDSTSNWHIFDNKREPENVMDKFITPNDSAAEGTTTGFDFLSNGFKSRTSDHWNNQSGGTYIYMAFAEEPLVSNSGTDGVPATAR